MPHNKQWNQEETAFLIYGKEYYLPRLSGKQLGKLLERTSTAIATRWTDIIHFRRGVPQSTEANNLIRLATTLARSIATNDLYIIHKQKFDTKINNLIDPLHEHSDEPADELIEPILEPVPVTDSTPPRPSESQSEQKVVKPFFSFDLDVEAVIRIIKAIKGT